METVPRSRREAGQRLRDARSACGLSLEQLARKLPATKDFVAQVESGERGAPTRLFDTWCRALAPADAGAVRTALLIGRQKDDAAAAALAFLLEEERARAEAAIRELEEAREQHRQELEALSKNPQDRMTPWRAQLLWRLGAMDAVDQPTAPPGSGTALPRQGPTPDGAAMALCALIDAATAHHAPDGLAHGVRALRVLVSLAMRSPGRLAGALAGIDAVASAIDPEAAGRDLDGWALAQHVEQRRPPPPPPPAPMEEVVVDFLTGGDGD